MGKGKLIFSSFPFPLLSFFKKKNRKGEKDRKRWRKEKKEGNQKERLVIPRRIRGITSHRKSFKVLEEVSSFHAALLGAILSQKVEPRQLNNWQDCFQF